MKYLSFLLCLVFLTSACKKHSPQTNNGPLAESPGPAIQLTSFPLKPGNIWVYDNGDTLRVVADTVINGMAAEKLVKTNGPSVEISYYTNKPDGLYLLGTNARPYSLENPYGGFGTEALTIFSTPMLLVKYPVIFNDEWSTNEPGAPYSRRSWVSFVSITNSMGTFNCAKLNSVDGHAIEYYSDKGLIRAINQPECFTTPCPPIVTNLIYVNF